MKGQNSSFKLRSAQLRYKTRQGRKGRADFAEAYFVPGSISPHLNLDVLEAS